MGRQAGVMDCSMVASLCALSRAGTELGWVRRAAGVG